MTIQRITDPSKVAVQLNLTVPFEFREHLHSLASANRISVSHMCRNALMSTFPMHKGVGDGGDTDAEDAQAPS